MGGWGRTPQFIAVLGTAGIGASFPFPLALVEVG